MNVGRTLYWLATIVAALILVFALADFFTGWAQGAPIENFGPPPPQIRWIAANIAKLPELLRK